MKTLIILSFMVVSACAHSLEKQIWREECLAKIHVARQLPECPIVVVGTNPRTKTEEDLVYQACKKEVDGVIVEDYRHRRHTFFRGKYFKFTDDTCTE